MADDKTKRGAGDRARIAVMEDYEVKYFAQKHSTTQKRIKELVAELGNSRNKVEAALKREGAAKKGAARKAPTNRVAAKKVAAKKSRGDGSGNG